MAPAKSRAESSRALDEGGARHVLNRFAFGPKPGEPEALVKTGLAAWLDGQLGPAAPDPELERALAPYRSSLLTPAELVEEALGPDWMNEDMQAARRTLKKRARRHTDAVALAELTRHILSQRQLEEVMVDFWTNHFNVFARKGFVPLFAGDWIERVIRPRALGKFEDLLSATAHHPAMLIYLDNIRSVAARDSARRGLNENYARELLELHTLGADAGYSQADVTEVARIFTGWSVRRPNEGEPGFVFRARAHDGADKTVMGTHYAPDGEQEGQALLRALARHPATARHLARKLCARFVADDPPPGCVARASRAFLDSGGDIAQVLRAISEEPSFLSASARGSKLKSPLELVVSAARALGGRPDGSLDLARTVGRLGEPMFLESVPTGHPEEEREWLSSGGMLGRMSFGSLLASGKLPGLEVDLDRALPLGDQLVERANRLLLGGSAEPETLTVVRDEVARVEQPSEQRSVALALFLGGPEFQRQ